MDLRHLQYFVVVAEELHFTRAAERLNIGQPPLSQTIQRLENELGVLLFHRGTRHVELTEAGTSFLKNARTILALTEEAKLSMQQYGRGERGSIRIGFTASASFNPFVSRAISAFRNAYPEVEVALTEAATSELLPQLRDARVDVAFLRPSPGEIGGLREHFLFNETMMIAMPIGHPLATRPSLPLRALSGQPFVLYTRSRARALYDAIIAACQNSGFSPHIVQEAPQMVSTVHLVAAGIGVTVVTESMTQLHTDGVVYKPIDGAAPQAAMSLVAGPEASKVVERFIGVVMERLPAQLRPLPVTVLQARKARAGRTRGAS